MVVIADNARHTSGTTAVSGTGIWAPLNGKTAARGDGSERADDPPYYYPLAACRVDTALIETYVDHIARMHDYLACSTPLRFHVIATSGHYLGTPGACAGGRSIEPDPFDAAALSDWLKLVRPPGVQDVSATL